MTPGGGVVMMVVTWAWPCPCVIMMGVTVMHGGVVLLVTLPCGMMAHDRDARGA